MNSRLDFCIYVEPFSTKADRWFRCKRAWSSGSKALLELFLLQYLWHLNALQEQGFLCHVMCVRVKAALPEIFLRLPNRFHALLNWMITISSYGLIRYISFIVVGKVSKQKSRSILTLKIMVMICYPCAIYVGIFVLYLHFLETF